MGRHVLVANDERRRTTAALARERSDPFGIGRGDDDVVAARAQIDAERKTHGEDAINERGRLQESALSAWGWPRFALVLKLRLGTSLREAPLRIPTRRPRFAFHDTVGSRA